MSEREQKVSLSLIIFIDAFYLYSSRVEWWGLQNESVIKSWRLIERWWEWNKRRKSRFYCIDWKSWVVEKKSSGVISTINLIEREIFS